MKTRNEIFPAGTDSRLVPIELSMLSLFRAFLDFPSPIKERAKKFKKFNSIFRVISNWFCRNAQIRHRVKLGAS